MTYRSLFGHGKNVSGGDASSTAIASLQWSGGSLKTRTTIPLRSANTVPPESASKTIHTALPTKADFSRRPYEAFSAGNCDVSTLTLSYRICNSFAKVRLSSNDSSDTFGVVFSRFLIHL